MFAEHLALFTGTSRDCEHQPHRASNTIYYSEKAPLAIIILERLWQCRLSADHMPRIAYRPRACGPAEPLLSPLEFNGPRFSSRPAGAQEENPSAASEAIKDYACASMVMTLHFAELCMKNGFWCEQCMRGPKLTNNRLLLGFRKAAMQTPVGGRGLSPAKERYRYCGGISTSACSPRSCW